MNVRTNLLLPEELVKRLDEVAGPRGRSRYVADAVEKQLRRDRQKEAFEATFGTLSAADYPHWSTPEKVVEWVRERRTEKTDPGPEDDHALDPRLDVRDRSSKGRPGGGGTVAQNVRGG
jgi:hypothetical protein